MRNWLKLLLNKQPIEYPSDSVSTAVSKAVTAHRAALRDFENAVQDLLTSYDTLLDEAERRRKESKENANR